MKRKHIVKPCKGSNQYMNQYEPWKVSLIMLLAFWFLCYLIYLFDKPHVIKAVPDNFKPQEVLAVFDIEEKPVITDEAEDIESIIREVFEDDAEKALQLLTSGEKDTKCPGGENKTLNPNAVNTAGNKPAGSRDIGVFQINEYWQKTQGKFLFNPRVNIEIAHQLFEENGKSFNLWTCGKVMGI